MNSAQTDAVQFDLLNFAPTMSAVLDCAVFRTVVQLLTCGLVTCVLKNSECIKKLFF